MSPLTKITHIMPMSALLWRGSSAFRYGGGEDRLGPASRVFSGCAEAVGCTPIFDHGAYCRYGAKPHVRALLRSRSTAVWRDCAPPASYKSASHRAFRTSPPAYAGIQPQENRKRGTPM